MLIFLHFAFPHCVKYPYTFKYHCFDVLILIRGYHNHFFLCSINHLAFLPIPWNEYIFLFLVKLLCSSLSLVSPFKVLSWFSPTFLLLLPYFSSCSPWELPLNLFLLLSCLLYSVGSYITFPFFWYKTRHAERNFIKAVKVSVKRMSCINASTVYFAKCPLLYLTSFFFDPVTMLQW